MFNNKLASVALVASLALSGLANAAQTNPFYVGAEGSFNSTKMDREYTNAVTSVNGKFDKSKFGLGLFAGTKFTDNVGIEFGTSTISKTTIKEIPGVNAKLKSYQLAYLDAMGYMPVAQNVELVGSAGLGMVRSKLTGDAGTLNIKASETVLAPRIGFGAKYSISENISARAMVRYQHMHKDVLKGNTSLTLGVAYHF